MQDGTAWVVPSTSAILHQQSHVSTDHRGYLKGATGRGRTEENEGSDVGASGRPVKAAMCAAAWHRARTIDPTPEMAKNAKIRRTTTLEGEINT